MRRIMRNAGDRLYVAYMLRIWRVEDAPEGSVRASLEDARSGERRSFADLEALHTYLSEQAGRPVEQQDVATER
jgi:hypothetical protein